MAYIYEKLDVWQKAMQFAGDVMESLSMMSSKEHHQGVFQKTEGSAAGIAGAIAMGKSYSSKHDFARHLYQSRGALYETMTLLELLKRKAFIPEDKFADFDSRANQLTAMLTSLIKSIYTPKSDNGKQPT
jgi:four helix bundle protein